MGVLFTNNATSTLAADIAAGAVSLTVQAADAAKFPSPTAGNWSPVTVVDLLGNIEIMRCTARAGAVLTVTRAQEGTAAMAFTAGARVDHRLTAAALAALFVDVPTDNAMYGRRNGAWENAWASPSLTGAPVAVSPGAGDSSARIATSQWVQGELAAKAPLNAPVFTGDARAVTPATADNDTSIATTAFVKAQGYQPASGYTAADVLAKLLTVDGAGSGLDADLLDGQSGGFYLDRANHTGAQAQSTVTNLVTDLAAKAPLASPVFTGNPTITGAPPAATDSDTSVATTAWVQAAIEAANFPIGGFVYFPATSAPPNFLHCNGSLLLRSQYPELWAFASTSGLLNSDAAWLSASMYGCFSAGDGSTNFRIPDLRGEFIRGVDGSKGADPGRNQGYWQQWTVEEHTHSISLVINNTPANVPAIIVDTITGTTGGSSGGLVRSGAGVGFATSSAYTNPNAHGHGHTESIGNYGNTVNPKETRPRNVSLLACLRYK
jgi:microcystin-dependent protein